jgi:hypothetical protein
MHNLSKDEDMKNFYKLSLIILILGTLNACSLWKANYFPLKLGNSWTYYTNTRQKLVIKINRSEKVKDKKCLVLENYLENAGQPFREEFYALSPNGIICYKRNSMGTELSLDPPEPIMILPLKVGEKWEWQGKYQTYSATSNYEVASFEKLHLMGRDFPCYKILVRTKTSSGEQYETQRWYANNIGLLKEISTTSKGFQSAQLITELVDYDLQ